MGETFMLPENKDEDDVMVDAVTIFKYRLDEVDEQILRLLIKYKTIKKGEIAKYLGLKPQMVYKRLRKPALQEALRDLQMPLRDLLDDAVKAAVRRMRSLVNDSDKKIAATAAKILMSPVAMAAQGAAMGAAARRVRFETTVQADGTLLQSIFEEDAAKAALPAAQTIDAEVIDESDA